MQVREVGLWWGEVINVLVLSLAIFWPSNYTDGKCGRTDELLRTMSCQPGIRMPPFCNPFISPILLLAVKGEGRGAHTTVMGIAGALGKINFTSSNFCRRRQFSANPTQPAPLSPRPWAMITVAVCRFTAGMMRAVGGGILIYRLWWKCLVRKWAREGVV